MNMTDDMILKDYQSLVKKLASERGFDDETVPEVFTLLIEEIGELAKAIRKWNGQKVDSSSKHHDIEEEAADVFWLVLDLCNKLDIDLTKAFTEKEAKNATRVWK